MGRKAEGLCLRPPREPGGIWYMRWTINGVRNEESTGERDEAEAKKVAAQAYADALSGISAATSAEEPKNTAETALLWEKYLNAMDGVLDKETIRWRETAAAAHLIPAFPRVYMINKAKLDAYVLARLKKVQRFTVVREISALFCMLGWNNLDIPRPKIPALMGVRASKQREKPNRYTEAEAKAIVMALPAYATRSSGAEGRMPIRSFFAFLWETGLRPATVAKLSFPRHWSGGDLLTITRDIDKKRYGREVPLSKAAVAILEEMTKEGKHGPIFGFPDARGTRWRYFKAAALKAKVRKADTAAPYDFRHGRAADLLSKSGNNLRGVAFIQGWRDYNMLNRYAAADEEAARAVPGFGGDSGGAGSGAIEKAGENAAE